MTTPGPFVTCYPTIVGRILRRLRILRQLTQTEVAASIDISQPAWSKIERGETPINIEQLSQACIILGSSPQKVLIKADTVSYLAAQENIRVLHKRIPTGDRFDRIRRQRTDPQVIDDIVTETMSEIEPTPVDT